MGWGDFQVGRGGQENFIGTFGSQLAFLDVLLQQLWSQHGDTTPGMTQIRFEVTRLQHS